MVLQKNIFLKNHIAANSINQSSSHMIATILDGKKVAAYQQDKVKAQIIKRNAMGKRSPGLAVILVGMDAASQIYVHNKRAACEQVGIVSRAYDLPADTSQHDLLGLIDQLNHDTAIDGILVQLPLPAHLDSDVILERIHTEKDVDGFHPCNLGRLVQKRPLLRPCTPYGIIQLLKYYALDLRGLNGVVVGASNIVGRPMALELLLAGATVTICHRLTRDLAQHIQLADILVVAIGKRNIINSEWLKPGCIILDVGMHRLADGQLSGDLDFASARQRAAWITPVPGGVGPMTIATLLENTVFAAELLESKG